MSLPTSFSNILGKIINDIYIYIYIYIHTHTHTHIYIQDVTRLVDITEGGDFLGLCDQKSTYKHVSDFGRSRSVGHFLIPVHVLV